ncbi:hypothetical protein CPB84DRAFT_1794983, partial [Gymnopilus junonius]
MGSISDVKSMSYSQIGVGRFTSTSGTDVGVEDDGWGIIKPLDNDLGALRPSDAPWVRQRFRGPIYRVKSVPHPQIRVGGFTSIWGTISTSSGWRGRLVAGAVGSEEGWGGQELIGVCRRTRTREHTLVRIMGGQGSCRGCIACIPSLCGCGAKEQSTTTGSCLLELDIPVEGRTTRKRIWEHLRREVWESGGIPAPAEQEPARVVGGGNGWRERRRVQKGCWGTVK